MILAGLIVSSFNGKITTLSDTILSSSKEAVELCILMFGIVGLWSGLMNIALSLGITTQLQKLLTPFLTFLFPNLKNQKAKEYISTNIVGKHVVMGVGEEAPNVLKPNIYGFGLVTVGEKAVIPDGVTIGKNVCISGETSPEDYPDGTLPSGGAIVEKDGE